MTVSSDESSIARTYYESLRDEFERYAWEDDPAKPGSRRFNPEKAEQLKAVREEFEQLDPLQGGKPSLGQLYKIELDLTSLIPEMALRTRYWAIENRFRRVVPKGVSDAFFARHTVNKVEDHPEDELRHLARSMLDTIHANYGVNFDREILIRRLMRYVAVAALFLIAFTLALAIEVLPVEAQQGLAMITVIGMAGAAISTIQRLQKATSRDAMVDDGIFELMSLRIGWVSILMSIGIGGVSALFIYALISAGLLDSVVPQIAPENGTPPPPSAPNQPGSTIPQVALENGTPAPPAAQNQPSTPPAPVSACAPESGCPNWADAIYKELGLEERSDLFKLSVYAFVAGFAERFVPDTINKLAKGVFKDPQVKMS